MTCSEGFQVDPNALAEAHAGVGRLARDLEEFGERDEDVPDAAFGNDDLAAATAEFRDRWRGGVTALSRDAESLHRRLGDTIETYVRVDRDIAAGMRTAGGDG